MARVAFIGLGAMGAPMAGHLLAAGHDLSVYARRPGVAAALVAQGATACASPAEAARGAEFVFINVTATADVEEVLFSVDGVAAGIARGAVVIDHSTISAQASRRMAARLAEQGVAFLDAPVSGGAAGAQAARLSIMVGGEPSALERARPLLACLGSTITYLGASGAGQVAKACNQIVQVVNIQGIAEAMLFARAQGVDPGQMLAAISAGMAGSKMLDLMGPKMAARDFSAGIESRLHQKDFGLVLEAAQAEGLGLPATALVAQQLNALVGQGGARQDTSALLAVLEAANGRHEDCARR